MPSARQGSCGAAHSTGERQMLQGPGLRFSDAITSMLIQDAYRVKGLGLGVMIGGLMSLMRLDKAHAHAAALLQVAKCDQPYAACYTPATV
jgi:hypothetical protein